MCRIRRSPSTTNTPRSHAKGAPRTVGLQDLGEDVVKLISAALKAASACHNGYACAICVDGIVYVIHIPRVPCTHHNARRTPPSALPADDVFTGSSQCAATSLHISPELTAHQKTECVQAITRIHICRMLIKNRLFSDHIRTHVALNRAGGSSWLRVSAHVIMMTILLPEISQSGLNTLRTRVAYGYPHVSCIVTCDIRTSLQPSTPRGPPVHIICTPGKVVL